MAPKQSDIPAPPPRRIPDGTDAETPSTGIGHTDNSKEPAPRP